MVLTILSFAFPALLFGFISWRKYQKFEAKRQDPPKQWEGKTPMTAKNL